MSILLPQLHPPRSRLPTLNTGTASSSPNQSLPPRVPPPSHRHAAPCGPWPWVDLESEVTEDNLSHNPKLPRNPSSMDTMSADSWSMYPQSLYPNWTKDQLRRSGITAVLKELPRGKSCVIHHVDVSESGTFSVAQKLAVTKENQSELWNEMQKERPSDIRVRALFLENLSGPALQMIGTRYNIEPFFFSSSLNWIPSRYEEDIRPTEGDHITITLTFLRVMQNPLSRSPITPNAPPLVVEQVIDTQGPLVLRSSNRVLFLDLLSVHMVRATKGESTIISYHPGEEWCTTSAEFLHSRLRYAGQSVFWQNIFKNNSDPTFVLLTILWHALYAWDEAMEELYDHICWLESKVIHTSDMRFTQELHIISAHLLHYSSLLEDFRKSVMFILETPNPVLDSPEHDPDDSERCRETMKRECNNILSQIQRLNLTGELQMKRLQNVMNLVFSTVNIEDSRHMRDLTEATVRDSAAMKQISYLTMIFLPASFVATAFGMNIKELSSDTRGTLVHYIETVIPLSILTVWIIVAARSKSSLNEDDQDTTVWRRLWWPVHMVNGWFSRNLRGKSSEKQMILPA